MITIRLADTYQENLVLREHGADCLARITIALQAGDDMELDFEGVGMVVASTFLNPAIGGLFQHFSPEFLREHVHIRNCPAYLRPTIKMVAMNASDYWASKLSDTPHE